MRAWDVVQWRCPSTGEVLAGLCVREAPEYNALVVWRPGIGQVAVSRANVVS